MPPRRCSRGGVAAPILPPGGLLDWSAACHFSAEARPCRHCGAPTHLRDAGGLPADKVCAEAELAGIARIVGVGSGQGRL